MSLDDLGVPGEPVEDGLTFETNARIKARFAARATGLPSLADDSGLIVVADGRLQYFPLGSLPMPGSESGEPILLTNEVVYEPSASALKASFEKIGQALAAIYLKS